MTPERWVRLKSVLSLALRHPAAERAAVVDRECGDEQAFRRDVEELLAAQAEMGSFLAEPLLGGLPDDPDDSGIPPELKSWTRYEITERIGSGGMAVVYKARDPRLNRTIAVKVIAGTDDLTVRRFLREAEAQARVVHDNVLKVYETGVVGGRHYIAMQYVDGPTLLGVRDEAPLELKIELMRQIADGLHEAHRQGLVHRDIKPGNILVERGPEGLKPYLLDFGLAMDVSAPGLTQTGVVIGTPRYMPPERIQQGAAALDRRSDIYSLGATCYEFISGTPPFDSASGLEVLTEILRGELTPIRKLHPAVAPEIDAIVAKCLERDPQKRYASARALSDDLRRYLNGEAVTARPVGFTARIVKRARRHPRVAAAFAALLLVIFLVAGWGAYGYWRSTRQAELARQLGEQVRDIEWLFRAAQMSPVHGIGREKQRVRNRISRVEQQMAELGSIATGPGHYAIGRGLLTLGDAAKALEHLQLAWAAGYRTADAAMALGLAHADIFRIETGKALRIPAERERTARLRELEAAHRDRALEFLERGRSSGIVRALYADALIASHRGDVDAAVAKAGEAARETPWLFEAPLLAGHLEFTQAVASYIASGSSEAAARDAFAAELHYGEAQRIAPSSIDASLGRCAVAGLLLHMAMHRLQLDARPVYERGDESCARALVLEPDSAEAHRLYSDVVRTWAGVNVLAGRDPGDAYERATRLAERANELLGDDVEILLVVADTILDRAWAASRTGKDPRPAVAQAVATYQKVQRLDPRDVTSVGNMGQALTLRSQYEVRHSLDALPSLDAAVAAYRRAASMDPSRSAPYRNLGRQAIARADEHQRRGIDPAAGLNEVLRFLEQLGGDPAHPDRMKAMAAIRARLAR